MILIQNKFFMKISFFNQGENQNHIILTNMQISNEEYIFFHIFKIIVFEFHA